VALEGLSDHLLALNALLDGDDMGPASVPTRLAALCAEPSDRDYLRSMIEEAYALERRLMRGELDDYQRPGKKGSAAPERIVHHLESTLRAVLKDMVCGYLDDDVKRTADDLLRGEAEARPDPEPESDPLLAFGAKLRGRGRRRKAEPVLETWEDVVPAAPEPVAAAQAGLDNQRDSGTGEEPEFVVRRSKRAGLHPGTRPNTPDAGEEETQETFAVAAVREVTTEQDVSDWGFDDDPADYSAAI
jgi:hypothetical protein